jgi:hypothetical protein
VPKVQHKPIKRSKLGFKKKGAKETEGCPGLAHRTVSGAPGWINSNLPPSGFWKSHSAIIHRTVRCANKATTTAQQSTPTETWKALQCAQSQSSARRRTGQWTVTVRCTTGLSGGPSCQSSNGRTLTVGWHGWRTEQCPVVHWTVRCAHRQQPNPNSWFGGWGYKIPPTTTTSRHPSFQPLHSIQEL